MKGRNNLGSGYYNTYWKVSKSFKVYARVGHLKEQPSHYGRYKPVFKQVSVKSGDQIHDLHGGTFWVPKKGKPRLILMYIDKENLFPLSCVKRIKDIDIKRPEKYLNDEFHHFYEKADLAKLDLFLAD